MLCNNCGNQINENEKFCTQCGEPVEKKNLCPECKTELTENMKFCWQCGAKVSKDDPASIIDELPPVPQPEDQSEEQPEAEQPEAEQPVAPVQQPVNENPGPASRPGYPPTTGAGQLPHKKFNGGTNNGSAFPNGNNVTNNNQQQFGGGMNNFPGQSGGMGLMAPKKFQMISKYIGEPKVGISKATGSMIVCLDHIEYSKTLGSSVGSAFGLVGMAVAAKKANNDGGKIEYYYYQDIQNAYVGKYMGIMPAVVLQLNNGQTISFNGSFTNQSATEIVNTIINFKANN